MLEFPVTCYLGSICHFLTPKMRHILDICNAIFIEIMEYEHYLETYHNLEKHYDCFQCKFSCSSIHVLQFNTAKCHQEMPNKKKKSEKELDELNEKIALTNQQLYDIQKLASDKDAEIQTLKVKIASVLSKNEGLKRELKQEQRKNQNCDIKGDS